MVFTLDYVETTKQKQEFNAELMEYVLHPERMIRIASHYGMDLQDYFTELDY